MCLGPTGNLHGINYFLSLHTGRKITGEKFKKLVKRIISMDIAKQQEEGLLFDNHY